MLACIYFSKAKVLFKPKWQISSAIDFTDGSGLERKCSLYLLFLLADEIDGWWNLLVMLKQHQTLIHNYTRTVNDQLINKNILKSIPHQHM